MLQNSEEGEEVACQRGGEELGCVIDVLGAHAARDGELLSHGFGLEIF